MLATQNKTNLNNVSFLLPTTVRELMDLSDFMAKSELVPKDYRGKPANIMVALQMGMAVGLAPMQSLQSIAVINGKPSLWGDGALAIVKAHPDCIDVIEVIEETKSTCTVLRKGKEPVTRTFTLEEAKKANLFKKDYTPWHTFPKRMIQMRARAFAIRDAFPDALMGLKIAEEVQDYADEPEVVTNKSAKDRLKETLNLKDTAKQEAVNNEIVEDAEIVEEKNEINETSESMSEEEASLHAELLEKINIKIEEGKISADTLCKWIQKAQVNDIKEFNIDMLIKCLDWVKQQEMLKGQ